MSDICSAVRSFPVDEDLLEAYWGHDSDKFKVVEETEWVCAGKYDISTVIVEHDGRNYAIERERSGSSFLDYWYNRDDFGNEIELDEVEKIPVMRHIWKVKGNG
jgi:hypothetical protein